jgi:hypothetical protein
VSFPLSASSNARIAAHVGCWATSGQRARQYRAAACFLDAQPGSSGFLPQAVMRSGWLPTKEGS